jgi:putative MFS transporter
MPETVYAATRLDRLPVSAFHQRTAALLAYVFFFELGDLNSFAYAAPALRQQWQLSLATIATITSASFVGMFIGAMSAGTLSDHVGRKRALILTTLWYSSMSLLNALAWSVPSLFAARLLTGVGLSGMTVVAMTYIGEMFPSRVRGAFQARILMFGLIGIPATAYVARFAVPSRTGAGARSSCGERSRSSFHCLRAGSRSHRDGWNGANVSTKPSRCSPASNVKA